MIRCKAFEHIDIIPNKKRKLSLIHYVIRNRKASGHCFSSKILAVALQFPFVLLESMTLGDSCNLN